MQLWRHCLRCWWVDINQRNSGKLMLRKHISCSLLQKRVQFQRFNPMSSHLHARRLTQWSHFPFHLTCVTYFQSLRHRNTVCEGLSHTGTADRGYYTSFVRFQNRWIHFNDSEVEYVNDSVFDSYTKGGKGNRSGYLLFCERGELSNQSIHEWLLSHLSYQPQSQILWPDVRDDRLVPRGEAHSPALNRFLLKFWETQTLSNSFTQSYIPKHSSRQSRGQWNIHQMTLKTRFPCFVSSHVLQFCWDQF
jgi:hypothetical protein